MPQVSKRIRDLSNYIFHDINQNVRAIQSQGHDVIRLDVGSPDLPPPPVVVQRLHEVANNGSSHGYAGYTGIPSFRKAIAGYYRNRFSVEFEPDTQVLPLIGSKEGIANLYLAYLDEGDYVLLPEVSYPAYKMLAQMTGAKVYWLPMRREDDYQLDLRDVPSDILQRAKMLWLNYPNNPTGAVVDVNFYNKVVDFCSEHNILVASDNPYAEVTFEDYHSPSVLQSTNATHNAIEFMSFSKTYNMAGWRLGAAVGSTEAIANLLKVKSNVDSGHFRAIYEAGICALQEVPQQWIDERNGIYQQRRDTILETLQEMGLPATSPLGAMYVWASTNGMDEAAFVQQALRQAHVSLAPGFAYGPGGKGHVRFSLGVPDDRLKIALDRLKHWYLSN